MGRPPSCVCGTCPKCKHAAYMKGWYQRKTPEERKAWTDRRDPQVAVRSDLKRRGTLRRRASLSANSARMMNAHPDAYRAHVAVGNAIRDGRLTKQPCENCGSLTVEAHHDDYSKPLDVRWLCGPDHRAHHRR